LDRMAKIDFDDPNEIQLLGDLAHSGFTRLN